MLRSCCRAGCLRTPEHGATALIVTLWKSALVRTLGRGASLTLQVFLLSLSTFFNPASAVFCWEVVAWLAVFARRSVEPAWLLDPCVSLLVLLSEWSILLENYITGLAVFARRSVEPARLLGLCKTAVFARRSVELARLLKVLCTSMAWFAGWGVELAWLSKSPVVFLHAFQPCKRRVVLRSCRRSVASLASGIFLPGWLGSQAGGWSQPGFSQGFMFLSFYILWKTFCWAACVRTPDRWSQLSAVLGWPAKKTCLFCLPADLASALEQGADLGFGILACASFSVCFLSGDKTAFEAFSCCLHRCTVWWPKNVVCAGPRQACFHCCPFHVLSHGLGFAKVVLFHPQHVRYAPQVLHYIHLSYDFCKVSVRLL